MNRNHIYTIALLLLSTVSYGQKLTLEQCRLLALENNKQYKNSVLEIEVAREVKKEAYTNYFPKVSATAMGMQAINPLLDMNMEGGDLPVYDGNPANLAHATQFAYMPGVNIGLFNQMAVGVVNIMQPLYTGGKIKTGNELANLNIEVKEQQQKMSENEILLKTEEQYWLVIALQEKEKTLESYRQFLDKLRTQLDDAYKNGVIIKNDLLKVAIKQRELQVNKTQLQNGKKLALMQLCQTIGLDYDPGIVLDQTLDLSPDPKTLYVDKEIALPNRSELQLLEKSVAASKLETKMSRGDYLPTVGVGLTGYYLDQLHSGQRGAFNGLAFVSVSIPISDWWGTKYKSNERKLREKIVQNTLEDSRTLLDLQLEKAWTDLNEASDKVSLIKGTLEQTVENLKVNQDSYDNGLIPLSDLLEAQALKTETEDKLIEAKSQHRTAMTHYMQTTGR